MLIKNLIKMKRLKLKSKKMILLTKKLNKHLMNKKMKKFKILIKRFNNQITKIKILKSKKKKKIMKILVNQIIK